MLKRFLISFICTSFVLSNFQYVQAQDFSVNQLPTPGSMVNMSRNFEPIAIKGVMVNPLKPMEFKFIVDTGNGPQDDAYVKDASNDLVKYFFAGLTIPHGDMWVNLSPYEKNRIAPAPLGATELGRDMLAQDYILKQLTASMIYPENGLGREFWARIYARTQKEFGTTNIPVNTFNKVWIMADQAEVYENNGTAYVTKATLKVLLDEDYTALYKHTKDSVIASGAKQSQQDLSSHQLASQIIRQIVLPEIEKEVNNGKNFATVRQIYNALILAKWYKQTVENALFDAVYNDKNKIAGVNVADPTVKEQIFNRYVQAYKKGVFDYVKESATPEGQIVPRKYFSGGMIIDPAQVAVTHDKTTVFRVVRRRARLVRGARIVQVIVGVGVFAAIGVAASTPAKAFDPLSAYVADQTLVLAGRTILKAGDVFRNETGIDLRLIPDQDVLRFLNMIDANQWVIKGADGVGIPVTKTLQELSGRIEKLTGMDQLTDRERDWLILTMDGISLYLANPGQYFHHTKALTTQQTQQLRDEYKRGEKWMHDHGYEHVKVKVGGTGGRPPHDEWRWRDHNGQIITPHRVPFQRFSPDQRLLNAQSAYLRAQQRLAALEAQHASADAILRAQEVLARANINSTIAQARVAWIKGGGSIKDFNAQLASLRQATQSLKIPITPGMTIDQIQQQYGVLIAKLQAQAAAAKAAGNMVDYYKYTYQSQQAYQYCVQATSKISTGHFIRLSPRDGGFAGGHHFTDGRFNHKDAGAYYHRHSGYYAGKKHNIDTYVAGHKIQNLTDAQKYAQELQTKLGGLNSQLAGLTKGSSAYYAKLAEIQRIQMAYDINSIKITYLTPIAQGGLGKTITQFNADLLKGQITADKLLGHYAITSTTTLQQIEAFYGGEITKFKSLAEQALAQGNPTLAFAYQYAAEKAFEQCSIAASIVTKTHLVTTYSTEFIRIVNRPIIWPMIGENIREGARTSGAGRVIFHHPWFGEHETVVPLKAMVAPKRSKAPVDRAQLQAASGKPRREVEGGIDLNHINVHRTGKTFKVQFDPAQLSQLTRNGFQGFSPVVVKVIDIESPLPLLGIGQLSKAEENNLAQA